MLNSILLSAALLLGGPSVSANTVNVEPQVILAPLAQNFKKYLNSEIQSLLIENYAAPHWNLSTGAAWEAYYDGALKIHEITPNYEYVLEYDGGVLDILIQDDGY